MGTFFNWSDPEEMLGLLCEYVLDARGDAQGDPARETFLSELSTQLAELATQLPATSVAQVVDRLRSVRHSQADEFVDDPVLAHVDDCIEELERIKAQENS